MGNDKYRRSVLYIARDFKAVKVYGKNGENNFSY